MTLFSDFNEIYDYLGSKCPECNGQIITDPRRGESLCAICGLVIKEKEIDLSNERNIFSKEEKKSKSRTGDPITIFTPDISYTTHIFYNDIKTLNSRFSRLAKIDKTSKSHAKKNRSLNSAQNILSRIATNLRLNSNIKELAMFFCRKALKENITRGRTIEGMVIACLYYACRKLSVPISFKEFVAESSHDIRHIEKNYKCLVSTFNLKNPIVNPLIFATRYVSELGLSFDFERKVLIVIQKLPSVVKSGLSPIVLCSAVIYLVSKNENIKVKQKEIAKITGITELSIRNNFRKLKQYTITRKEIVCKKKATKEQQIIEELKKQNLTSIQLREKTNIPKDQIKMYLYELRKKNVIKRITDKIPFIYSL